MVVGSSEDCMVRVTVEIVPHGDEDNREVIGTMTLANVGGTAQVGEYEGRIKSIDFKGYFHVEKFQRSRGIWNLVKEAFNAFEFDI